MSENKNHHQLELFSQEHEEFVPSQKNNFEFSFLKRVRANEKALLLIFAFIIAVIASFSAGVNKGKQLSLILPREASPEKAKAVTRIREDSAIIKTPALSKDSINAAMPEISGSAERFTVQLASYSSIAAAQKEAALLKKKGFLPLVITKGKYIILCVGSFNQRQQAKSLLAEFTKEKRYQGCYVRRL